MSLNGFSKKEKSIIYEHIPCELDKNKPLSKKNCTE